MFTDTQSVSKTKHNLTYRMGQKIKLQTLHQILMNFTDFIFHKVM